MLALTQLDLLDLQSVHKAQSICNTVSESSIQYLRSKCRRCNCMATVMNFHLSIESNTTIALVVLISTRLKLAFEKAMQNWHPIVAW